MSTRISDKMWIGAGACLVIGIVAVLPVIGEVSTDGPMRLPSLTVVDNSSALIGQVVGYDNFRPLVLIQDGSNQVLLRFTKDSAATLHRVFYSEAGCSGTPYLPSFADQSIDAVDTLDEMQGVVYGIGKPAGIGTVGILYSSQGQTAAPRSGNSAWISINPTNSRCYQSMWSLTVFPAVEVVDLDQVYDPPFQIE